MKNPYIQNACSFPPPRHPSAPSWLAAVAGKGPPAWAWLHLDAPVSDQSPLARAIKRAYCVIVRQFVYANGEASMLIRGHPEEVARLGRQHLAGKLPEGVKGYWHGALPVPKQILDLKPMSGDRYIEIVGFDPEFGVKADVLRVVSHYARINLSGIGREPGLLGVHFRFGGSGRSEAIGALEELHIAKALPSPERSSAVLMVLSGDYAELSLPAMRKDRLVIEFRDSAPNQLNPLFSEILSRLPADHELRGYEGAPQPGCNINAAISIYMRPRPQEVRDSLEQQIRDASRPLDIRARVYWIVDGIMYARPDIG